MARLIDADALYEEVEFHPTSVSVCMTVAEAKGQTYFKNRCLEDIDNAPTISAIPVEWLEQRRFETSFNGCEPDIDLNYAFCTVMNEWQKEQEGQ